MIPIEQKKQKELLRLIEENCRLTPTELAVLVDEPEAVIQETIRFLEQEKIICGYRGLINWEKFEDDWVEAIVEIRFLEQEKIICGYRGLINWEKFEDDWVEAIVEIRVTAQGTAGYQSVAEEIKRFPQVETVYFLSGPYDFLVMLRGKNIKEISNFISNHLAPIDVVQSTRTHFTLKKYKDWGLVLDDHDQDERIKVSP